MNFTPSVLKKSVFCLLISALCGTAFAQTNIFPTAGNVGIGTTNPGVKVEVVDGGGSYQIGTNSLYWSGFKTTAPAGIWGFQQNERAFFGLGGNLYNRGFSSNAISVFNGSVIAEDIVLFNQNNPDAGFLVLKASGNVGIGTASPAGSLHIVSPSVQSNSPGTGIFLGKSLGGDYQLQLTQSAGTPHIDLSRGTNSDYDARISSPADNQLSLGTVGGGQVLNIVSGNVGIGTTSPFAKLTLGGTAPDFSIINQDGANNRRINIKATDGEVYLEHTYSTSVVPWNFKVGGTNVVTINGQNVGIGTTSPTHKLAVNGTIRAKEVIVDTGWADYVFADDYRLAPLSEVESHIKAEKHLPGIPSAQEVAEHGISVGEMQSKLLAKVEELTLHVIEQEKAIRSLRHENSELRTRMEQVEEHQ